jgi:transposase-like protein
MSSLLAQKHLQDEGAAYAWVEAHLWPEGPVCPHCGSVERISKMAGKATRFGLYKCYACRQQFRVTVGTIFEKSHVPLHVWLQAFYLLAGSKKGISANQLHRTLDVTLKTAWFMGHRIREAMRSGSLAPMGGAGSVVEIDETIHGRAATHPKGRRPKQTTKTNRITNAAHKNVILSLVERGGQVRSYHVAGSTVSEVIPIVQENVSRETAVMTDSAQLYKYRLRDFASHDRVDHSKGEYAQYPEGRPVIHTNTVEGYFSLFKRGMRGVYQHCKERHLHRYLAEFDHRYNNRKALGVNDEQRAISMVKGVKGKRLTYRTTDRSRPAEGTEQAPPF